MLMKPSCESDTKAILDAFLRAVDEGGASPDILSEPNDATIKAINELENGQTTHCSSYEDYISKI